MPDIRATLFRPNPRPGCSGPLVEPGKERSTIPNHPEFGAFWDHVHAILDSWAGQNAPPMDGSQVGDKPNDLIRTRAEDRVTFIVDAP